MLLHIVAIALLALPALADAATTLTVREAIALAVRNNDLAAAARLERDAARQGVTIARSRYLPAISFEESLTASNAPTQVFMMKLDEGRFSQQDFQTSNLNHPAASHDFRTAITLRQALFDPAAGPSLDQAAGEARGSEHAMESVIEDVAFAAFRAYLDVQKSLARLKAAEQAIAEAQEGLRLARVRFGAGAGLKSDELRAGTHLSSVEQNRIAAANDLALARLRLIDLLGLKSTEEIAVPESIAGVVPAMSSDDLLRQALESSSVKRSRSRVETAEAGKRLARSAYLPWVGAFAGYQTNAKDTPFGAENEAWVAGVSLKWQLFDGFRRCSETDRAAAQRAAAARMLDHTLREAELRIKESSLRREETGKRLEVARNALANAEETVRLIARRFENSLATMAELLDAQTVLNQMRAGVAETEAEYALAGGRIYYAAGIFSKEMTR